MLPKKNRADKKALENIFRTNSFLNSSNLSFKFLLNKNLNIKKISFIVPKNIAKNAVKRNLLRRLGYNIVQKQLKYFPSGIIGVFIYKKYIEDISILENEIKNIINKIN